MYKTFVLQCSLIALNIFFHIVTLLNSTDLKLYVICYMIKLTECIEEYIPMKKSF